MSNLVKFLGPLWVGSFFFISVEVQADSGSPVTVPADSSPSFWPGFWEEQKTGFFSPLTDSAATRVLLVGAGVTTLVYVFRHSLDDPMKRDALQDNRLHGSTNFFNSMGQWIPNLAYSAVFLGSYWITKNSNQVEYAKGMLEATTYASIWATGMKFGFNEQRPDTSDHLSFPSGHATTAFAFSSYIWAAHGWEYGVPATVFATAVGYARIASNKHWLHDVLAGATLGATYGVGVFHTQHFATKVTLLPLIESGVYGAQVGMKF